MEKWPNRGREEEKRNAGTRGRRDGGSTRREKDKKVGGMDAVHDSWEE